MFLRYYGLIWVVKKLLNKRYNELVISFFIYFNMKEYFKYLIIIIFTIFSFYYADKVIELSEINNTILVSIDNYASLNDSKCIEGEINNDCIILGLSGIVVDKNKSYSNMKGIGFREELVEYKKNKCILNKEDNLDKYILRGNRYDNKVSLVIDVDTLMYYDKIKDIFINENVVMNTLTNLYNLDKVDNDNVLYKDNGNNIKSFKKIVSNFYCVKTNDYEIINDCKKEKISSIRIVNYINDSLLLNTKKILDNGVIIFIKENNTNTNELMSTIKYIKSRGYSIVSIDELLS